MTKLNQNQVSVYKRYLTRWSYSESELFKSFSFRTSTEALEFLSLVLDKARELDSTPEVHLVDKQVSLHLRTIDEDGAGVTGKDFALAMAIEQGYRAFSTTSLEK